MTANAQNQGRRFRLAVKGVSRSDNPGAIIHGTIRITMTSRRMTQFCAWQPYCYTPFSC